MGKIKTPEKAKLICGMITSSKNFFKNAEEKLSLKFGKIDFESEVLPFVHTDYYESEFGKNLLRKFISFEELINQDNSAEIKIFTNKTEEEFSVDKKRKINLDAGIITLSKLILFSTKDYYHRIYLNKGIYAEITLFFKDKTYQPFPWTYPDYKTQEYINIFNQIRKIYSEQLKINL